MKSGVDSECDAIHIRQDIRFSRREKSDVSSAEAPVVLLKIINDCVATYFKHHLRLFIYRLFNYGVNNYN